MPLRRLFRRLRPPHADPQIEPAAAEPDEAAWGSLRRRLQAELQALETAATARRLEGIPESLWVPLAVDLADGPAPPGEFLEALLRERQYVHRLLEALRPPPTWAEAGARLRPLCQQAFGLSGFYLARADWGHGRIVFEHFFEAGRPTQAEPLPLSPGAGLTGWALHAPGPCYLDSLEACLAQGMRLTEAERQSGLVTRSWFGVQLPGADPARPAGLMAFHCYHADAFGPNLRRLMTWTAQLAALHLGTPIEG